MVHVYQGWSNFFFCSGITQFQTFIFSPMQCYGVFMVWYLTSHTSWKFIHGILENQQMSLLSRWCGESSLNEHALSCPLQMLNFRAVFNYQECAKFKLKGSFLGPFSLLFPQQLSTAI